MPIREIPARPNLEHLKNQAHTLLDELRAQDPSAGERFGAFGIPASEAKLADALHVIAREYGFSTWPALKSHLEPISEDPVETLIAALKANDVSLVRDAFSCNPSLQSRIDEPLPNFGFEAPSLIAAVNRDNREMVDVLLDMGANINERSRWWAGSYGVLDSASPALAAYLIDRGATVDIHAAARLGMLDRVRSLLASDAQLVHARGGDGQLPLHFAASVEIAALLIEAGAALDARDIDHESTAVQYMVCLQPYRHDVAKFLIAKGAQSDIYVAAAVGDGERVRQIVDHNPDTVRIQVGEMAFPKEDPRAGGSIYFYGFGWGRTPHMVAHRFGHMEILEYLMVRSSPWLRLAQACEIHDEALAAEILAAHPRLIQSISPMAARRIVGATTRNNTRAVEMLVAAGWPVAVLNDNNQTPLHYAAWHGNLTLVTALLARNAPVHVLETQYGGSPLGWALHGSLHSWERNKGDYPGVVRALLAAGADIPKPLARPLQATEELLGILREHDG